MTEARKKFKAIGVTTGLISGLMYGLYTTFVLIAGYYKPLAGAVGLFAAPYVTSGLNDLFAGIWLTAYNVKTGRIREIGRSLRLFPGKIILIGSLVGGPIASGAYLMGLAMAGAYAIPISAMYILFGALFARIFLKQKIVPRVGIGMVICVVGAIVINWVKPEGSTNFTLGIICAFVAAIGWALEGVFAAYGSAMLDTDVVINIRQLLSGIVDLIVILPMVGGMGLLKGTLFSLPPVMWLLVSGLCAAISYLCWYKSNSTIGCAMGMSLNITYAFWGVLFCILFLKQPLTPTIIIGSIIIILGAVLVSVDPFELLKKKEEVSNEI
ncbi:MULTISPECIES: DMT family transporter [Clostridia]|uniref:DMT family transporter n=1 Tax=Clostridia TaxID=186801 RepID=UPI0012B20309|nr:DMT family transporter [Clostridium sp. WB02_MRS01]MBW4846454.1 DMT family transporter [Lachnospiraceae bacterium]MSS11063.1 DMT family transporter [Clostridium sp. WB02_MRS01]